MNDLPDYLYSPSYWLPPLSYYASLSYCRVPLIIEQFENYQKRSFRNRGNILAANGSLMLSVPLQKGKNHGTPIQRIKISYEFNWRREHLRSIMSAYGSAPFYEYYMPQIEGIYAEDYEYLVDWNQRWLQYSMEQLQLDIPFDFSSHFMKPEVMMNANLTLEDSRNLTHLLHYNESFWYPQVFQDRLAFNPKYCILDLLFSCGPESSILIQQYWKTTIND